MDEKFREALRKLGYGAAKINDLEIKAVELSMRKGISEERARAYVYMGAYIHKHSTNSPHTHRAKPV